MHLMKHPKEGYKDFTNFSKFYNDIGKNGLPTSNKGCAIKS